MARIGRLTFPISMLAFPFYLMSRSPGKQGSHYDPEADLFVASEAPLVSLWHAYMLINAEITPPCEVLHMFGLFACLYLARAGHCLVMIGLMYNIVYRAIFMIASKHPAQAKPHPARGHWLLDEQEIHLQASSMALVRNLIFFAIACAARSAAFKHLNMGTSNETRHCTAAVCCCCIIPMELQLLCCYKANPGKGSASIAQR